MYLNKKNTHSIIALIVILLITQSCLVVRYKPGKDAYINNDSTAIYSTHSSRPFKYGYAYSKEQCKTILGQYVLDYQIEKGDSIADIGGASGWIEGAFSVLVDSVNFYVEDIDTNYLNKAELNKVVAYYNKIRERPQTNTFNYVIGTEKKTNLPDSTFDKVIFNNTYHEILYSWDIIDDANRKIKPNGKIMIREAFSNSYKKIRHNGCNIECYTAKKVIKWLKWQELYLTGMTEPENSFYNHLTFEKSNERSENFYEKKSKVDKFIKELDKFNEFKYANDSNYTILTSSYLKDNLKEINAVYRTLENYINTLGYQWLNESKLQSAINVLKVNVVLYPNSSNVYDSLAEAYMKSSQYNLALLNYIKSVNLNTDNSNAKEQIKKLKAQLNITE